MKPIAILILLLSVVWPWSASDAAAAPEPPAGAATASRADSLARPITLAEALAVARRNAPAEVQARGQTRNARASARAAYAAFLPNVSLSAGTSRQFTSGVRTTVQNGQVVTLPSNPWSYSAGLSASVLLFGGGNRLLALREANAGVAQADASRLAQGFATRLAVSQQYFGVLAARESEVAANAQLQQADQQYRAAIVQVRAGSATKSDSLRAVIALGNARLAVIQARNGVADADAALARAIGSDERVTATPDGVGPETPIALDEPALAKLAEDGPAVREARAARDAARAARAAAWTGYLPSLSVSYGRTGGGSGPDAVFGAEDLTYNGAVRLSVSFPLFDQLGRESQVVRSTVALDNAEAALRDARLAARQELTSALGTLRSAAEQVATQGASVRAAEEDLRVQQRRYSVGGGTLLDVLTSQTQLDQARQTLIKARYDQRIARAQLEALVGREL